MWGWSSWPPPLASGVGLLLPPAGPGLGRGATPLITTPDLGLWVSPLGRPHHPRPRTQGSSSWPVLRRRSLVLSAAAPDLGRGVTPLGHCPSGIGSSQLLPLTSDMEWLLSAALGAPVATALLIVLSYDPLYFCVVCCDLSIFISNLGDVIFLPLFLDESG